MVAPSPFGKYRWTKKDLISFINTSARLKAGVDINAYEHAMGLLPSFQKCLFRGQSQGVLQTTVSPAASEQIHDIWLFSAYRSIKDNLCLFLTN